LVLTLTGAEHLPALRPADGGLGEEGGEDGEQPAAEGQGQPHTGILREAVPRDPQAAGAAGTLPEVIPGCAPRCAHLLGSWEVCPGEVVVVAARHEASRVVTVLYRVHQQVE